MTSLFVGVDSGGTRTNVGMTTSPEPFEGATVTYEVDEALSGALDPSLYATSLRTILAPLESYAADLQDGDVDACYLFVSAAAYTAYVRDDLIEAIREVCPHLMTGNIHAAGVANDAVTLLLGLDARGVVIAGTGSNVLVRSPEGDLYQVGGHEWVACDYGSAFWIGLRAIRQAYRDYEAGEDTVLLNRLREQYGLRSHDDKHFVARLRDLAIADSKMKREVARFAASVCAAASRGDHAAQNIVKAEAEELADVTAGALRRRYSAQDLAEGITLVQCGSVLANEFYQASFEAQLDMRLRSSPSERAEFDWHRMTTGVDAALNMARALSTSVDEMLELDSLFRPAVVRLK